MSTYDSSCKREDGSTCPCRVLSGYPHLCWIQCPLWRGQAAELWRPWWHGAAASEGGGQAGCSVAHDMMCLAHHSFLLHLLSDSLLILAPWVLKSYTPYFTDGEPSPGETKHLTVCSRLSRIMSHKLGKLRWVISPSWALVSGSAKWVWWHYLSRDGSDFWVTRKAPGAVSVWVSAVTVGSKGGARAHASEEVA